MSILSFLNQDSYQLYNRHVARYCGNINAAVMLSELINRFEYHHKNGELSSHEKYGDDWFYLTMEKAEERTCLSRKEQDLALKTLKNKNFIETCIFGLPAKRYFKLNEEKILEIFGLSKKHSSLSKRDKLDCTKGTNLDDQKGQTAHIYKNPTKEHHEEPTTTTGKKAVEVVHKKISEEDKKVCVNMQAYLANRVTVWGDAWKIPIDIFEYLCQKYGANYLNDQILYIIDKQIQALKDENSPYKKRKTEAISKPETYLKLSCQENYACSKNIKENHERI
jgi:hypothetical protein